jgi:hypothetical protein
LTTAPPRPGSIAHARRKNVHPHGPPRRRDGGLLAYGHLIDSYATVLH